jgi:SAM-dependent methyltransferase
MERYAAETYGDRIADVYDAQFQHLDPEPEAEFLAGIAGAGPVLELGIGTGRVALPLLARGVTVHGVDASERMVEKLRAKPGGRSIPVTIGDFSDFALDERFTLVYVVFNTFYGLLTQDDQVRCFERVAAHLRPGGRFLVRGFVPDLRRFERGQCSTAVRVELDDVRIDVSMHDAVTQVVRTQHVALRESGVQLFPVALRYAWPSELDLMARLAGLRLEARHGGWQGEPFTANSDAHVSVYRAAGAG